MSQDFGGTNARWTGASTLILGYTLEGLETARNLARDGITVELVGTAPNPDEPLPMVCDLPLAHGLVAPNPGTDLNAEGIDWYLQTRTAVDQGLPPTIAIEATATLHHRRPTPGWRPAWTKHVPTADIASSLPDWPHAFAFPVHVVDPPRLAAYLHELAVTAGATIRDEAVVNLDTVRDLCRERTYDVVVDTLGLTGPSTFEDPRAQWAVRYIDRYLADTREDRVGSRVTLIDGDIFSVIPGPRYVHVSSRVAENAGIDDLDDFDAECDAMGEDALHEARMLRPDLAAHFARSNQARYIWTRSFNPFGPTITLDHGRDGLPPVLHLWYVGENSTALYAGAANALAEHVTRILVWGTLDADTDDAAASP